MAKNKKQRPADEGPPGAPEWVVTFTDMISLLVTFFVLLMTFSSLEQHDLLKVESWLSGDTGLLENRGMVMLPALQDDYLAARDIRRGALQPHTRPADKLAENLAEMGQKKTEEDIEMSFENVADGVVIQFGDEDCFEPGSVRVPAALCKGLGDIGRVLENYPHLVVVEGFTDSHFSPTSRYPTAESISFARASAAADIMLRGSKLPAERLQIVGRGADDPRRDNETAEGRRWNRRVQIRVVSLSELRASYLEARGR